MDNKIKLDGKKKKVIVQGAQDYYNISPIRPTQISQPNFQIEPAISTTRAIAPDVCVIGETTITRIPCVACKNNVPTSSNHVCQANNRDERSKTKVPGILRKSKGSKSSKKEKIENATLNLSSQLQELNSCQGLNPGKTPRKVNARKNTGKKTQTETQESNDSNVVTLYYHSYLKPNTTCNLTYSESVNEAIVMDLLDKKYGNVLETELVKDVNENDSSALNLASTQDAKINNETDISTLFEIEQNAEKDQEISQLETLKAIETILILDSPDKNYKLFTPHELKSVPQKIFESPMKIKEEKTSPTKATDDICASSNDSEETASNSLEINNSQSVTSENKTVGDNENSLELSSEPLSNIFGEQTYQQLMTSGSLNANFSDIANDIEVVTTQKTDTSSELEATDPENCTKIWELKPQDINFDVLKDSYSPKPVPESQDMGFYGFSNNTADDGAEKSQRRLGNLLDIISRDPFSKRDAKDWSRPDKEGLVAKLPEVVETMSDLIPHEVVSQSDEIAIIIDDIGEDEMPKSGTTETLDVAQDESIVEAVETPDSETVKNHEIMQENPPPEESLSESSQIDIDKCDILVLKVNGELEPLTHEETKPLPPTDDGDDNHYAVQEHCYCSLDKVDALVTEGNAAESNLEDSLELIVDLERENQEFPSADPVPTTEKDLQSVAEDQTLPADGANPQSNNQLSEDLSQLSLDGLGREKNVVKSNAELMELKNRIMEGKINREEILEIIESKNIIQYSVNVDITESNSKYEQQRRDAKHLGDCLKKQIGVMKKSYEYFEEIIDSTTNLLDGNLTDTGMKNIFDNLNFVKDIVDKTFAYYKTGASKENKVKYKVINIMKKDAVTGTKPTTKNSQNVKKKTPNKLLPRMLYRMNRLLEYLETNKSFIRKRRQNAFISKLKEMARVDYNRLKEMREKMIKRKVRVAKEKKEARNSAAVNADQIHSGGTRKILGSIENTTDAVAPYCKAVITPLSKDVKIILSQIERLQSRGSSGERKTTEEIHTKLMEEKSRRISRAKNENATGDRLVVNAGKQDEVILVETTPVRKKNEVSTVVATPVLKKVVASRRSRSGKVDNEEALAVISPRCSRRVRKPPDFYAADKYLSKVIPPSRPKVVVDTSNLSTKRTKSAKRTNLTLEFKNDEMPCIVLYDEEEKPKVFDLQSDERDVTGKLKTDLPKMKIETDSRTKGNSQKKESSEPVVPKRLLRSATRGKIPLLKL